MNAFAPLGLTDIVDFNTVLHWWRRTCTRQASLNGSRRELAAHDSVQDGNKGHRITPSWVGFTDEERLCVFLTLESRLLCLQRFYSVGDSAKNAFHSNPENTVFDAKRLIGRNFNDNEVQRDMKHWPFKVKASHGKPIIEVKHKGDSRDFVSYLFLILQESY